MNVFFWQALHLESLKLKMPVKKTLLNSRSFDIYQDRNKYYEVKILYIIISYYSSHCNIVIDYLIFR